MSKKEIQNKSFHRLGNILDVENSLKIIGAFAFIFSVMATYGFFEIFSKDVLRALTISDYFSLSVTYLYPIIKIIALVLILFFLLRLFLIGFSHVKGKLQRSMTPDSGVSKIKKQQDRKDNTIRRVSFSSKPLIPNSPFEIEPTIQHANYIGLLVFLAILCFTILLTSIFTYPLFLAPTDLFDREVILTISICFYIVFLSFAFWIGMSIFFGYNLSVHGNLIRLDNETKINTIIKEEDLDQELTYYAVLSAFHEYDISQFIRNFRLFRNVTILFLAIVAGPQYGKLIAIDLYNQQKAEYENLMSFEQKRSSVQQHFPNVDLNTSAVAGVQLIRVIDQGVLAFDNNWTHILFINDEGQIIVNFEMPEKTLELAKHKCLGSIAPWLIRQHYAALEKLLPTEWQTCKGQ